MRKNESKLDTECSYICPVCGKDFINYSGYSWAYKCNNEVWKMRFLCSYTCFRKYSAEMKDNRVSRRKLYNY